MKVQIKSISGHQTSKVIAICFALFTTPFALIGGVGFFAAPTINTVTGDPIPSFPWLFFAFAPIFYGLMAYFFNRIGIWCYNHLAKRVGGIEYEVVEKYDS